MAGYTMQIIWLVLIIGFAILEGATVSLVSIWFCIGSIAALLISFITPSVPVQIAVCLVVSIVVLLAMRPYARKRMAGKQVATNADRNIGRHAQVIVEIRPDEAGRVRLDGVDWSARAQVVLPVGTWCRVDALEGATFKVSPIEEKAAC